MTNRDNCHRLMVLGSMDEFVRLVEEAQGRGIYVIVCDGYADGPAKRVADKSFDVDVRDVETVAKICVGENVDGIISSFSDVLAESLVAIAELAGLPCYLDTDNMRYLRDKTLMKKMFDEINVPYPSSSRVFASSVEEGVSGLEFPLVVKPISGYGSHGVCLVNSVDELKQRFEEAACYSEDDSVLCEQYNDGYEFNMMTWVLDGTPIVLDIADREKTHEVSGVTPHVSRIVYPSRFTDSVLDEARSIVSRVASYVGLKNGPLCMQFFWSPDRGIQVCECAGRIFGYEHELLELAGGPSVEEILIDYVYDQDSLRSKLDDHSPFLPRCSAGLYFHGYEGVVAHLCGLSDLVNNSSVAEVLSYYAPGDSICRGVGSKPYVVRVYLKSEDYSSIDSLTKSLYGSIHAFGPDGNDLLYRNEMVGY